MLERTWNWNSGIFMDSGLVLAVLPTSLQELGHGAFFKCRSLKNVIIPPDSQLKRIGGVCFSGTALRDITFRAALMDVCYDIFEDCTRLRMVYVDDRCRADFFRVVLPKLAVLGPLPETTAGDQRVWDLRTMHKVVIPDGVERIGGYWFFRTAV